jgi:hypothetical protein
MFLESLVGVWLFTSVVYQGQEIPRPNPALKMYYEFSDTGTNTLRYSRDGEQGFCERRSIYEFSGKVLTQEVVWVHPGNASWCDQDVDMRLGTRTRSNAWLSQGRFFLEMSLADEKIIYIWTSQ